MSSIFSILACVGVVIYFISKYREALAKLNKMQKVSVLISYMMTIIIAGICIYYGGAFLTQHFQNEFVILLIRFTIVMIILWVALFTLNGLLQKITNGIFPKIL